MITGGTAIYPLSNRVPHTEGDLAVILRELGAELRRTRKHHGWTRKELQTKLGGDPSVQTLATYELGTRYLPVTRLLQLAAVFGERPGDLLNRVADALCEHPGYVLVDPVRVALGAPWLEPVRTWLKHHPAHRDRYGRAALPAAAIPSLAELCGLDHAALVRTLTGW